jgi:Phage tail assembly chaperone protein, TAC
MVDAHYPIQTRHAELVSASIHQPRPSVSEEKWTLKQVEGDGYWVTEATHLCGQTALFLGWRPNDFWNATPAELASVLYAITAQAESPPNATDLQKLMELFPDAPTGGE